MTQSTNPGDGTAVAFSDLGLSEAVLKAVETLGYEQPTPVQAQAIPYVLEGRDLLAAAQTGTGKTAAFLLPTMSRLGHAERHRGPKMLIVTPTRELAQQIADVCATIEGRTHHRSYTVVGGVGYEPQKAALRRGLDILVATPGRLVDLIEQGEAHLDDVEVLVLDEADRMLDMGFLPAMRKIVGQTPSSRQTLLFSATLDEDAIGGIRDLVSDPAVVEIAHKGSVAETIDQFALPVSLEAKNALLPEVLKQEGPKRVIVFCRTKHRADACCRRLRRANISCAPIHGDRSQNQRERALRAFRDGSCDVLVATDVLARGIDVSDVRYVVNFDVPVDAEDYIHRIGRTGRAGEAGWALTFVTENDADELYAAEKLMGKVVPPFEPSYELELGDKPVELNPDRDPEDWRPLGKKARKKREEARKAASAAARKRALAKPRAEKSEKLAEHDKPAKTGGTKAPKAGGTKKDGPSKAAKSQRPGSAKLTRREVAELELETEGERRQRSRGGRRGGRRGGGQGRDGRPQQGGRANGQQTGRDQAADRRQRPAGGRGGQHRRVGDRAGRQRGIY